MKVIFLDIDGVLVTRRSCISVGQGLLFSKPDLCGAELIKHLSMKYNAKIVISSTWRHNQPALHDLLKEAKIPIDDFIYSHSSNHVCEHRFEDKEQCWRTPVNKGVNVKRGEEVKEWLARHPKVTKYVIFDDDSDFLDEQLPNLLRTTFDDGILLEHYHQASALLKD